MKSLYLAMLLTALAASGCATTPAQLQGTLNSPGVQAGAAGADVALTAIFPPLAHATNALTAATDKLADIEAARAPGEKDAPLSTREWIEILGALGLGLFGVNAARDRKYAKVPKATAIPAIVGTTLEAPK